MTQKPNPDDIEGQFRVSDSPPDQPLASASPENIVIVERVVEKVVYRDRPSPAGHLSGRIAATMTTGTVGPAGEYSGYECEGCRCPLALGSTSCPDCQLSFPEPTPMHPAQPRSPNPPGYHWDKSRGRFIPQRQYEREGNNFLIFLAIGIGILLLMFLFVSASLPHH